jgi:hypothetical protein
MREETSRTALGRNWSCLAFSAQISYAAAMELAGSLVRGGSSRRPLDAAASHRLAVVELVCCLLTASCLLVLDGISNFPLPNKQQDELNHHQIRNCSTNGAKLSPGGVNRPWATQNRVAGS